MYILFKIFFVKERNLEKNKQKKKQILSKKKPLIINYHGLCKLIKIWNTNKTKK